MRSQRGVRCLAPGLPKVASQRTMLKVVGIQPSQERGARKELLAVPFRIMAPRGNNYEFPCVEVYR